VLGLEVVLADGSVLRTGRRTVKGVAGYDLTRLIVGSEGTLAVITEATLALRPAAAAPVTMVATFDTTAAGGDAVAAIIRAGLTPSMLELMDRASIRAVNDFRHLGLDECAVMLIAQSDAGPRADEEIAAIETLCGQARASATYVAADADEGATLLEARRAVILALDAIGTTVVDDVCVPRTRLAGFLDGVEKISADHGVLIAVVAHAGDGNTHPNVVFDPSVPDEQERAWAAYGAVMDLGLDLGGTITGEHGVGLLKRPWLERELGPVGVRVHAAIKDALDPLGILNPGKVLDFAAVR
jgi:glycolate oxidase